MDKITIRESSSNTSISQVGGAGAIGIQGPAGTNGVDGATGLQGLAGSNGVGIPIGGATGQILAKVDATNYNTNWINPPAGGGGGGTVNEGAGTGLDSSTAYGKNALVNNQTGIRNTAIGFNASNMLTTGSDNVAIGNNSAFKTISAVKSIAIGTKSLYNATGGSGNIAFGYQALYNLTSGNNNISFGSDSLFNITNGGNNIVIGTDAAGSLLDGNSNIVIGSGSMYGALNPLGNVIIGNNSMTNNGFNAPRNNVALGINSLNRNIDDGNTAIGSGALVNKIYGWDNTAIGINAGNIGTSWNNCTFLGANSQVTANNQVQIGDSTTTTFVYGTVQNRSDLRDKADVRDTSLGLAFIMKIKPREYRFNYREDYITMVKDDSIIDPKNATLKKIAILNDGSKKRNRLHQGVIAQEVKAVMVEMDVDFGGFQDHSLKGGNDVQSIGYDEFIAPLIKAIQEQQAQIEDLKVEVNKLKSPVL